MLPSVAPFKRPDIESVAPTAYSPRSAKLPLKLSNKTMTEGTRAYALAASIALKKNLMVGVRLSPT